MGAQPHPWVQLAELIQMLVQFQKVVCIRAVPSLDEHYFSPPCTERRTFVLEKSLFKFLVLVQTHLLWQTLGNPAPGNSPILHLWLLPPHGSNICLVLNYFVYTHVTVPGRTEIFLRFMSAYIPSPNTQQIAAFAWSVQHGTVDTRTPAPCPRWKAGCC